MRGMYAPVDKRWDYPGYVPALVALASVVRQLTRWAWEKPNPPRAVFVLHRSQFRMELRDRETGKVEVKLWPTGLVADVSAKATGLWLRIGPTQLDVLHDLASETLQPLADEITNTLRSFRETAGEARAKLPE